MEREVGGEFRLGDTCTPIADSGQCMAKTTTINFSVNVFCGAEILKCVATADP